MNGIYRLITHINDAKEFSRLASYWTTIWFGMTERKDGGGSMEGWQFQMRVFAMWHQRGSILRRAWGGVDYAHVLKVTK
jgi:hypothetical protein